MVGSLTVDHTMSGESAMSSNKSVSNETVSDQTVSSQTVSDTKH